MKKMEKKLILVCVLAVCLLFLMNNSLVVYATEQNSESSDCVVLQNKIDGTENGGLLKLDQDYVATQNDKGLTISNKRITIDLNGHSIDYSNSENTFGTTVITCQGTELTIIDSSIDESGSIVSSSKKHSTVINVSAQTGSSSSLTIHSGSIIAGASVSNNCIKIGTGNSFLMTGGTLTGARLGYAIDLGGDATITGGKIVDNYSGAIMIWSGASLVMTGGEICNNYGGIMLTSADSSFTLEGGSISNNVSSLGAVCVSNGSFEMSGGKITGNHHPQYGAGVKVDSGSFTMSGGEISGNISDNNGGGLYAGSNASIKLSGGMIVGNKALSAGGGVYSRSSSFVISGEPIIKDNVSGNIDNEKKDNLLLWNNNFLLLSDALSEDAEIGLTKETMPTGDRSSVVVKPIEAGESNNSYVISETDLCCFKSDATNGLLLLNSSGEIVMRSTYVLNVENGTGGGTYLAGTQVTLVAEEAPDGKEFDKWISEDGIEIENETEATITIDMPAKNALIKATYKDLPTTATPSFYPNGGVYDTEQNVSISCETTDAVIHFTLDGTEPTANSRTYTEPISVSESTIIKAIAVKDGMLNSAIITSSYTIRQPSTVAVSPKAKRLVYSGAVQELISPGTASGGEMLYSLDGVTYDKTIPKAYKAGNYVVYYKVAGDETHIDSEVGSLNASIEKADSYIIIEPTAKVLRYTGKAQRLVEAGWTDCGTIMYSLDGVNFSSTPPMGVDAKTYTVYYKVVGTANYKELKTKKIKSVIERIPEVSVNYSTQVQDYGWQPQVKDGSVSGTSGKSKRLETIRITLNGNDRVGVQYTTHVEAYGWMPWSSNGEESGTVGESKRLEAIKIQLVGQDKDKYDIYYRVHAQNVGWMNWAKNGAPAGTAGYAYRLEAIQIQVVEKGRTYDTYKEGIQSASMDSYRDKNNGYAPIVANSDIPNLSYRTHVQNVGWQSWKTNGGFSGTSGRSLRLEGINIKMTNKDYTGGIRYKTHIQNIGWEKNWRVDGEMSGTSGRSLRLEAIDVELYGEMAQHYDVYYRVHAQDVGWMGWAKNGEHSGTAGYGRRLEGIQIVLVPKNGAAPVANYGGINANSLKPYLSR